MKKGEQLRKIYNHYLDKHEDITKSIEISYFQFIVRKIRQKIEEMCTVFPITSDGELDDLVKLYSNSFGVNIYGHSITTIAFYLRFSKLPEFQTLLVFPKVSPYALKVCIIF